MAEPIAVTDDTFDEEVLQSSLPVVTDFWADWCGPCHAIAPILEEIASEQDGQLKVTKMDVDSNPLTPTRYGVRGIPTLIVFNGGQPVETLVGWMPKEQLLRRLSPYLHIYVAETPDFRTLKARYHEGILEGVRARDAGELCKWLTLDLKKAAELVTGWLVASEEKGDKQPSG